MIFRSERSQVPRYGIALLTPVLIAGAMALSWPLFGANPVTVFLAAVVISAWYGGLIPGILSLFLSLLLSNYFFIEPHYTLAFPDPDNALRMMTVAAIGAVVSITCHLMHREYRRAESNLADVRESEKRFRATLENMMEGCQIISHDWRYIYLNAAAEEHGGVKASEVLGRTMGYAFPGIENTPAYSVLKDCMDRRVGCETSNEFVGKDGTTKWFQLVIQPIEVGLFILSLDITERKRSEKRSRRMKEELEKRVADRTAELLAANDELESFSYSVSHDLRAPLRHINGFSEALLEDYAQQLDGPGRVYLNEIRDASREMSTLIDDMLQLARVARSELRREHVDLSDLARNIADELIRAEPERAVTLNIHESVSCDCDGGLARIVLTNLIANAWKFTSKAADARIEFGETKFDGRSCFFVRDNGAGFDMKHADKLFGPFQRLHSGRDFEGSGIGLATARRIIIRHGGSIWADSEVGRGATFYFTLGKAEVLKNEAELDPTFAPKNIDESITRPSRAVH